MTVCPRYNTTTQQQGQRKVGGDVWKGEIRK